MTTPQTDVCKNLVVQEIWGEAARMLASCVNDVTFVSLEGKSKHQLCGCQPAKMLYDHSWNLCLQETLTHVCAGRCGGRLPACWPAA